MEVAVAVVAAKRRADRVVVGEGIFSFVVLAVVLMCV